MDSWGCCELWAWLLCRCKEYPSAFVLRFWENIEDAHQLLDEFPQGNDLISWNTLMGGYLHLSQPHVIVDLFKQMRNGGFEASLTTVLYLLSAIGDLGSHFLGSFKFL